MKKMLVPFNGAPLHVKQNAIGLYIHALVLKRHLSMHSSPFRDVIHEWYTGKAIDPQSLRL